MLKHMMCSGVSVRTLAASFALSVATVTGFGGAVDAATPLLAVSSDAPIGARQREALDTAGFAWIGLIDDHHALVRGEPAGFEPRAGTELLDRWTWDRKAPPQLLAAVAQATPAQASPIREYLVLPAGRGGEIRQRLAASAAAVGGQARLVDSDALALRITTDHWGLSQLLALDDVLWAEPSSPPDPDDYFVREFGGANEIELLEGFTGAGVVLEVLDQGLRPTHADFAAAPPILLTDNGDSLAHGTAAYGVIFGDASTEPLARGLAPDAVGYFGSYLHIEDRDAHLAAFAASPINGVIQSSSWGSGITRRYSAASAEIDDSIFRHGVLLFQSQSNNGGPDSRPEAWAKNLISVGGVQGMGTLTRGDDVWGGLASTGPGLDARIKPDLTMFNDGILTTGHQSDTHHREFTGTSAATPAVAGHAAVMVEMWRANFFHQSPSVWAGREPVPFGLTDKPSVATAKALLINSATPYGFDHIADDLGRYRQGWGTPDLRSLRDRAASMSVYSKNPALVEDETWTSLHEVSPGGDDLRITLVYTDPAGLPLSISPTVNDLDLRVYSPSGVVYHGNWGLHDGVWSVPGGDPDPVNTVENVFIEHPEHGVWTVEVRASRVIEDARPQTPEIDAPYSLVVSGADEHAGSALVPIDDLPATIDAHGGQDLYFRALGFNVLGDGVTVFESDADTQSVPLRRMNDDAFVMTVPELACGTDYTLRLEAPIGPEGLDGPAGTVTFPADPDAPGAPVRAARTAVQDAPGAAGWTTTETDGLYTGGWEFGPPAGGGMRWDPATDSDGDGQCWLTDNRAGNSDVSNGTVTLTTPEMDLLIGTDPVLRFDLWLTCDEASEPGEDTLMLEISTDGGSTWTPLAEERSTFRWVHRAYDLRDYAIEETCRFRFSVTDGPDESITEAAIDNLRVTAEDCLGCVADYNGDGQVDLIDLSQYIADFQVYDPAADIDGDGVIGLIDLLLFITDFNGGC